MTVEGWLLLGLGVVTAGVVLLAVAALVDKR